MLYLLFTDINECTNSTNDCHRNSTCTNSIGSYSCECNQGFNGNGTICIGMKYLFELLYLTFSSNVSKL